MLNWTITNSDNDDDKQGGGQGPATGTVVKVRPKTEKPAMYRVLLLNDD